MEPIPADIGRCRGTPWVSGQFQGWHIGDKQPFMLTFTPMEKLQKPINQTFGTMVGQWLVLLPHSKEDPQQEEH